MLLACGISHVFGRHTVALMLSYFTSSVARSLLQGAASIDHLSRPGSLTLPAEHSFGIPNSVLFLRGSLGEVGEGFATLELGVLDHTCVGTR